MLTFLTPYLFSSRLHLGREVYESNNKHNTSFLGYLPLVHLGGVFMNSQINSGHIAGQLPNTCSIVYTYSDSAKMNKSELK